MLETPRDSNCSLSTFLLAFWQTWRNLEFVWDGDVAEGQGLSVHRFKSLFILLSGVK